MFTLKMPFLLRDLKESPLLHQTFSYVFFLFHFISKLLEFYGSSCIFYIVYLSSGLDS